jgi:carbon storage regulator CsrA
MLVLARRPNETIVFPDLGIRIQVIRVAGKEVRLGIDAPPDILVLREEVADGRPGIDGSSHAPARQFCHELRNRLNAASLGLQVLQRRLALGETHGADTLITRTIDELQQIDAQLQPQKHNKESASARGRRALIVEDDSNESELLAAYLRICGYEVDTVDDGLKALSYLKQGNRPDAVLLDMCMPQLDGAKTISSIRREPMLQGVKLFAVSGGNQEELGVEVGPRGVDRWFSKPVNADQLVRELNRELDETVLKA